MWRATFENLFTKIDAASIVYGRFVNKIINEIRDFVIICRPILFLIMTSYILFIMVYIYFLEERIKTVSKMVKSVENLRSYKVFKCRVQRVFIKDFQKTFHIGFILITKDSFTLYYLISAIKVLGTAL